MSETQRRKAIGPMLAVGALALAGCGSTVTTTTVGAAASGGSAEEACVTAVNVNSGSRGAAVQASETSSAGTRVSIRGGNGLGWTCTATGAGVVASLSVA